MCEEPRISGGVFLTRRCSSGNPACPYELRLIPFTLLMA